MKQDSTIGSLVYKKWCFNLINPPLKRVNFAITTRLYSTKINKNINIPSTNSTNYITFSDADKDKLAILDISKGRSGIYMWTNKLNAKKYVGSSVDLRRRLLEYYNVNRILNEKSMPINVALLKYGYIHIYISIKNNISRYTNWF